MLPESHCPESSSSIAGDMRKTFGVRFPISKLAYMYLDGPQYDPVSLKAKFCCPYNDIRCFLRALITSLQR